MDVDLLREHAARCRALVEGASPLLVATFLQLARDLDAQADAYERDEHEMLRRRLPVDGSPCGRVREEA